MKLATHLTFKTKFTDTLYVGDRTYDINHKINLVYDEDEGLYIGDFYFVYETIDNYKIYVRTIINGKIHNFSYEFDDYQSKCVLKITDECSFREYDIIEV